MATSPDAVRAELAVVTAASAAELRSVAPSIEDMLEAVALLVPAYYDAAGALAVAWYDELRSEASPSSAYFPAIIGNPATDWIDREAEKFRREIDAADIEAEVQQTLDEIVRLAEKEVARGYRESILGNVRQDRDALGWSRVTRPGACKFCAMLAAKGAVFSKETANFAAHTDCNCAARPEFHNGEHGPEASVEQYLASTKSRTPEQRAQLREYLLRNFPDAPG